MNSTLNRLVPLIDHGVVDFFIPESLRSSQSLEAVRSRLLVLATFLIVAVLTVFTAIYWWFEQPLGLVTVMGLCIGSIIGGLFYLRHRGSVRLVGITILVLGAVLIIAIALQTGGLRSPAVPWVILLPLVAQLFGGPRTGWLWAAFGVFIVLGLTIFHWNSAQIFDGEQMRQLWMVSLVSLLGSAFAIFLLANAIQVWLTDQLAVKTDHLRAILQTAPNGILSLDDQWQIQALNPAAQQIFGTDEIHLRGQPIDRLLVDFDGVAAEELAPNESLMRHDLTGTRGDGKSFPLSISLARMPDGSQTKWIMLLRDDTKIREVQARMMHADRMSAVGTLAVGVGHEINNPLSYLKGNIEFGHRLLTRRQHDRPYDEFGDSAAPVISEDQQLIDALEDSRHGLERIESIIDDLGLFTKTTHRQTGAIDIHTPLNASIRLAQGRFGRQLSIRKEFGDIPPVSGDVAGLSQVFLNLLLNAAQAIEDDPKAQEIAIATAVDGNVAQVTITDDGVGMSDAVREQIFDPFYTTKNPRKGTGLGLSIAHAIITELDGQIAIDSTLGQGTCATICVPLAPPPSLDSLQIGNGDQGSDTADEPT